MDISRYKNQAPYPKRIEKPRKPSGGLNNVVYWVQELAELVLD